MLGVMQQPGSAEVAELKQIKRCLVLLVQHQPKPAGVAGLIILLLQDAFGMLTEMGKEGVMPTVDTFNTLMDACIRRVNPAAVPRLFKQMEQSGTRSLCCIMLQSLTACASLKHCRRVTNPKQ